MLNVVVSKVAVGLKRVKVDIGIGCFRTKFWEEYLTISNKKLRV